MNNQFDYINEARIVFEKEINALNKTKDALGEDFVNVLELILKCTGKLILTGMGKPGHIASKMSATFASLGIPSFFMHPGEAMHGDLGMVEKKDVVMLMSYSGESEEVTRLMPVLHEIGCITIAITGKPNSTLAHESQYHFFFPEFEEACYLHLAPTSSTTSLLVLGDALAVVASKAINYTRDDFGLHHPAGSLGKKLLVKVKNLMYSGNENAVVSLGTTLHQAIVEMSNKGLCLVTIVDNDNYIRGIITDGDLRRMLDKRINVYDALVDELMTSNPKTVDYREMAVYALQMMSDNKITSMPVTDENNHLVGAILMQDIIKAGIIR